MRVCIVLIVTNRHISTFTFFFFFFPPLLLKGAGFYEIYASVQDVFFSIWLNLPQSGALEHVRFSNQLLNAYNLRRKGEGLKICISFNTKFILSGTIASLLYLEVLEGHLKNFVCFRRLYF